MNGYHDTSDESVLRFPDTKQGMCVLPMGLLCNLCHHSHMCMCIITAYATSTGFEGALYKSRTKGN